MDHMTTNNPEGEVLLLSDTSGNSYVVRREAVEHGRVPKELNSEVLDLIDSDTQGYGDANFLLKGVLTHMGLKMGMKGYDGTFDLDGDGDTDWDDYSKAKEIWYQQYGKPKPSSATGS